MGTIQDVLTKCSKCGYANRLLPTSDKTENGYSIGDTINTQCLGWKCMVKETSQEILDVIMKREQ